MSVNLIFKIAAGRNIGHCPEPGVKTQRAGGTCLSHQSGRSYDRLILDHSIYL